MDVNIPELAPPGDKDLPYLEMTMEEAIDLLSKPDGVGVYEVARRAVRAAKQLFPEDENI